MSEALPRATQVLPHGGWVERTAKHIVTLDFDDRFRRRRRYVAESGFAFLLDLEEATPLRDGDGLLLGLLLLGIGTFGRVRSLAGRPCGRRDRCRQHQR